MLCPVDVDVCGKLAANSKESKLGSSPRPPALGTLGRRQLDPTLEHHGLRGWTEQYIFRVKGELAPRSRDAGAPPWLSSLTVSRSGEF